MLATLNKTILKFSVVFILKFANIFGLDKPKVLLFGKEIKKYKNYAYLKSIVIMEGVLKYVLQLSCYSFYAKSFSYCNGYSQR